MLSVVIPAKNEQDNIAPLVKEIVTALRGVCSFEILYVDDGSTTIPIMCYANCR